MKKLNLILIPLYILLMSTCDSVTDVGDQTNYNQPPDSNNQSANLGKIQASDSDIWVSAYLASWSHYAPPGGNWGNIPTDEIDWEAFTHLIYFSVLAQPDGSLSKIADYENMAPDRIKAITQAGSDNNTPVIISIGGWGNYEGFSGAIRPENRSVFVANLVELITVWGFDGIDLDMEPIRDSDVENYKATVKTLHSVLQTLDTPLTGKPLLTAALMGSHASIFAELQEYFDQINIMTYDYSGAWEGWVSWHNSPLFSGGHNFPGLSRELPSVENTLQQYRNAGVDDKKLGIGMTFEGYVWHGQVDSPRQSWDSTPRVESNVPYHKIMDEYYSDSRYNWDSDAGVPYLSIPSSNASDRKFISYEDERSVSERVHFARNQGIGGVIIWELGQGHRKNQPAGQRDPLLQAVKEALHNGNSGGTPPQPEDNTPPEVALTSPSNGATVSGTVEINIEASGSNSISNVELLIEGANVENFSSTPYSYSWNSASYPDQKYEIEARAIDVNGNSSSTSISVTVANNDSNDQEESDPGQGTEYTAVYSDQLADPWIDASWSASVNYNSSENSHSGSRSIKVDQNSWGALSMRKGNWGAGQDIQTDTYKTVEFAVYAQGQNAKFSVMFENDQGQSFPRVSVGTVSSGSWTIISIPMNDLNPNGRVAHRLNIMEESGANRTYYVDDIRLTGASDSSDDSDNSEDSGDDQEDPDPGQGTEYTAVYSDQLADPWIDTSWSASVNYNSSENNHSGNHSVKVDQNSWGALSMRKGNWGAGQDIQTDTYKTVEFAVYAQGQNAKFSVMFENDQGQSFPRVSAGTVSSGSWTIISIPMNDLNPNGQVAHRLNIMEESGANRTYYVDDIRLIKR